MKQRLFAVTFAALLLASTVAPTVLAATTPPDGTGSSQALEISPPVIELSGSPGETVKTQISVRDVANTPLIVKGQVNDFVANDSEDGIPKILVENGEESPYSMKSWFSPLSQLTLQPKKIENLTIAINIPKTAAPGGYYSTIRFTANPPGVEGTGVSLSASLGALVLMRVKGDAKESLSVAEFGTYDSFKRTAWLFESSPVNFVLRTKNDGNIHEQPVGQATVKDMFGSTVGLVNINLDKKTYSPAVSENLTGRWTKLS